MTDRHFTLKILLPLIFYLIITLVLTYPIGFDLHSWYLATKGDPTLWLWNLWWVNSAIGDLQISPFHTDYIFHPTGVDLRYHNFSFYNSLLGIPLIRVLGLIPTYNLLI